MGALPWGASFEYCDGCFDFVCAFDEDNGLFDVSLGIVVSTITFSFQSGSACPKSFNRSDVDCPLQNAAKLVGVAVLGISIPVGSSLSSSKTGNVFSFQWGSSSPRSPKRSFMFCPLAKETKSEEAAMVGAAFSFVPSVGLVLDVDENPMDAMSEAMVVEAATEAMDALIFSSYVVALESSSRTTFAMVEEAWSIFVVELLLYSSLILLLSDT